MLWNIIIYDMKGEIMDTKTGYEPSAIVEQLKERALSQPDDMFLPWFRNYYYLEGWMKARHESLPIRNVKGLCSVIDNMPVLLHPDEIIIGESGERQFDGMINFMPPDPKDCRDGIMASALTDEQKSRLVGWMDENPFSHFSLAPVAPMPEEVVLAQRHGVIEGWGTDLNHSIRAYEKVLRLGFSGLRAEVEDVLTSLDISDPNAGTKSANLLAWKKLCESAENLGKRHAVAAREQAASCSDPAQKSKWEEIAEVCERVPAQPARSFREAVQSLWFAHIITVWEDAINANGIGRIDQFLWPYLESDIASGRTTWQEAKEVLAALWLKLYRPYDVQQMMIGGQHSDGSDAVNPLSYAILDVTEGLGIIRCLSARLHKNSPREFVSRCVDLVARGGGIPFFFNDEALIPALVSRGIPLEDARLSATFGMPTAALE